MKIREWFRELHAVCQFTSVEVPGKIASNSELQRWIEQGALLINGERVSKDEPLDFPIISVILHPKSTKRRCTLY